MRKIDFAEKRTQFITVGVIGIFYLVGILGHAFDLTYPMMIALTPWVLLIFGALVFSAEASLSGAKLLIWAFGTFAVTLAAEIIGVATGAVFGEYIYGVTLGLKLLGVPLVIGFNWMVIVLGCTVLTAKFISRKGVAVFVAAVLAVVFDFIMEPVAIRLDYWTWDGGSIPLQNYIAWFVIALTGSAAYTYSDIQRKTWIPTAYVAVQAVFFIAVKLVIQ